MNHLWLIIKREYITRVRNKSFIIMTFVTPIAIVILSLLIGYLTNLNNNKVKKVTILDNTALFSTIFESSKDIKYTYLKDLDKESIKKKSIENKDDAFLYIPASFLKETNSIEFFSEESANDMLLNSIVNTIEDYIFHKNLENENIKWEVIEQSKTKIDVKIENYSGERTSKSASSLKMILGILISYLLMMFIIIYGNMIMRSVIEEKTNRIVEIIISSVKPFKLMLGKILGTVMVGITQFLLWLLIATMLFFIASNSFGIDTMQNQSISLLNSNTIVFIQTIISQILEFPILKIVISFLLYFIGGFLLYSSLYASIGAAVDSETDTQQFLTPVLIPLILAIYVGLFTTSQEPNGIISVIFSYIPLTSPIVMLMRIPFGVSWWEIFLSLSLVYITFFLFLWIASKIYRIGILMYGQKTSYKDLYKWIKNG